MNHRNEIEFDLMQMLRYLFKKAWIILLAVVVLGIGGYLVGMLTVTPEYTTSCRIYIYQEGAEMNYSGLQLATQLSNDCEILITGRNVTEPVVENLNLNIDPEAIGSRIEVSSEENTRILELAYTDPNPERAAAVLNEICRVASVQIQEVMKVDAVTILYPAEVPQTPSSTGPARYALLAAILGVVLSVGVLVVIFLMDDTIHNEDEVEHYLGLSTLASIPVSEELGAARKPGDIVKNKGVARFIKR